MFLAIIGVGLAVRMAATFATANGPLMIVLSVALALAAGVAGTRIRRWWWVIGCPGAMLGFVLLWELVYGRETWRSLYVFMLGVVFCVVGIGGSNSWCLDRQATGIGREQPRWATPKAFSLTNMHRSFVDPRTAHTRAFTKIANIARSGGLG